MLVAEEGEGEAAVRGVDAALLWLPHVEDCLVQLKVSSNEVTCHLILICENKVIKS